MTDLEKLKKILQNNFGDEFKEIEKTNGYLSINEMVPLPILASKSFDRTNPVHINDNTNNKLGEIYFVTEDNQTDINSFPLNKFICFAYEYPNDNLLDNRYEFKYDYVLIDKAKLSDYLTNYKHSSAIWGGYYHIEDLPNISFNLKRSLTNVEAIKNIGLSRTIDKENLEYIIKEQNPFNRFLKLYHLLEVQFDIHTAQKIKTLLETSNKEKEISLLLKDYNREDIYRLTSLMVMMLDINQILPFLNEIKNFNTKAQKIFYEYGKESNPLKKFGDFDNIINSGGFAVSNVSNYLQGRTYNDFIAKITAYWIYRVRSSIAHNKLGEYLMTSSDEGFMVEFAEPLLRKIVIDCYR